MKKGFVEPFTMEVCKNPSMDEASMEPGSGVLAAELRKIGEHRQAVRDERNRLVDVFGDHRAAILDQTRRETHTTIVQVDPALIDSGAAMQQQRAELRAKQEEEARERKRLARVAKRARVHPGAIADLEKVDDITKLLTTDD